MTPERALLQRLVNTANASSRKQTMAVWGQNIDRLIEQARAVLGTPEADLPSKAQIDAMVARMPRLPADNDLVMLADRGELADEYCWEKDIRAALYRAAGVSEECPRCGDPLTDPTPTERYGDICGGCYQWLADQTYDRLKEQAP